MEIKGLNLSFVKFKVVHELPGGKIPQLQPKIHFDEAPLGPADHYYSNLEGKSSGEGQDMPETNIKR